MPFFTYILTCSNNSFFFIGVTQHLSHQMVLHWYDHYESVSPNIRCYKLLWYERHDRAASAIQHARRLRKKTKTELNSFLAAQTENFAAHNGAVVEEWPPSSEQIVQALKWKAEQQALTKTPKITR